MARESKPRKRYVLFKSTTELTAVERSGIARMIGEEGPDGRKRVILWMQWSLIVKSSQKEIADLIDRLNRADIHGGRLSSVKTSGSIGKLKKLARSGRDDALGQVLQ